MKEVTDETLSEMKAALMFTVEEWLGNDIPDEGTEDYDRWQMMLVDIDDIVSLSEVIEFLEYLGRDDEGVNEFLSMYGLDRS